jgi:hypothetical protein
MQELSGKDDPSLQHVLSIEVDLFIVCSRSWIQYYALVVGELLKSYNVVSVSFGLNLWFVNIWLDFDVY